MLHASEIILENHYGSHQPAVFVEDYLPDLQEQGLAREASIILDADHAVNILYDNPNSVARFTEKASVAWMRILDHFVPEQGYHLGYIGASQVLWMIPDYD